MMKWFALHTKPHKERQVQAILDARNVETYLPFAPRSGPGTPERPFFASYMFAHADLEVTGLWGLQYIPGMRRVVSFGANPASVREDVIGALKERLAHVTVVDENGRVIEPGDRVRISSGPLRDLDAVFDRHLSAEGRARVLIQLLQRWTAVELDTRTLVKVGGFPRPRLVRTLAR